MPRLPTRNEGYRPGVLMHAPPDVDYAEVACRLRPSTFPADRTRLLVEAIENHAPPEIIALLEGLQPFSTYRTMDEVSAALGAPVTTPTALV